MCQYASPPAGKLGLCGIYLASRYAYNNTFEKQNCQIILQYVKKLMHRKLEDVNTSAWNATRTLKAKAIWTVKIKIKTNWYDFEHILSIKLKILAAVEKCLIASLKQCCRKTTLCKSLRHDLYHESMIMNLDYIIMNLWLQIYHNSSIPRTAVAYLACLVNTIEN